MRLNLSRWLLTLAGSTLLTVTVASAQPNVRDHRRGRDVTPPNAPVNAGPPREAPPPPKAEKIGRRNGWVWVAGTWEWKNGQWAWESGRWEKERRGKRWKHHRWEKQGDVWVHIDGSWDDD